MADYENNNQIAQVAATKNRIIELHMPHGVQINHTDSFHVCGLWLN